MVDQRSHTFIVFVSCLQPQRARYHFIFSITTGRFGNKCKKWLISILELPWLPEAIHFPKAGETRTDEVLVRTFVNLGSHARFAGLWQVNCHKYPGYSRASDVNLTLLAPSTTYDVLLNSPKQYPYFPFLKTVWKNFVFLKN